jgi:hypothetical protein
MGFRSDLEATPTADRPAVWRRAPVGYRLAWGGQPVAIVLPTTPTAADPARWVADRIDSSQARSLPRFRHLADAVAWSESADWYGPVAPRIARG